MSSPADASSASDSASWTTTSVLRVAGAHAAAGPAAQHLREIAARRLPRRRESEQQARRDRNAEREQQYRHVEPNLVRLNGQLRADEHDEHLRQRRRDGEPGDAADERQHHALREQLLRDAPAPGAERGAHRQLARARRAARELQIRDVRARDEQHQRDGAEDDE